MMKYLFTIEERHLHPKDRETRAQTDTARSALGRVLRSDIGKRVYQAIQGENHAIQVENDTQRDSRSPEQGQAFLRAEALRRVVNHLLEAQRLYREQGIRGTSEDYSERKLAESTSDALWHATRLLERAQYIAK